MLEWMQKHRKYLVITVWVSALALIFASMVEWGGGGFSAGSRDSVARVGDLNISSQEYQKAYYDFYNMIKQYMPDDDGKLIPEIEQEVFRGLVREKMFEVLAQDIGVSITPEEVRSKLISMPEFHNEMNVFSKQQYLSVLEANNRRPDEFEEVVAKALLLEKMQNFPIFPLSSLEVNAFLSAASVKDKIQVRILDKQVVLNDWKPKVSEDDVRNYWKENKERYFNPPSYKVAYIALNLNDIAPTQEKLRKFYDDNISHYKGTSFENIQEDLKQDYQKTLMRFASSYMSNLSKDIAYKDSMAKNNIQEVDLEGIVILEDNLESGRDIDPYAIPVNFIEIKDNDFSLNAVILENIAKGEGLLNPFEYETGKWFMPYIVEKVQKRLFDFEEIKEKVQQDFLAQLEEKEFRRLAILESSNASTKQRFHLVGFINMSDWYAKNTESYRALSGLGLHDDDIKHLIRQVMDSDKLQGIAFLDSSKAVIYQIVQQEMPSLDDLTNASNQEINALEEAKIRDLRSALIEYGMNHYKIIDYRRQK